MRLHRTTVLTAALCCWASLSAQIGGRHVYDFLNLATSARIVALGGMNVSLMDEDVQFGVMNPALVNPMMSGRLGLSFSGHLAGIRYGYAAYSRTWEGIGSFHSGVQYLNSGAMQGADEFGNLTGEFSANEWAWTTGISRAWRGFRYGANVKLIQSSLAPGFTSWGAGLDLGAAYRGPDSLFSAGLTLRNLGVQLSSYVPGAGREPLPFEIVAGVSNKLRYMPLRFSITATNLEHPVLRYIDRNAPPELDLNGEPIRQPSPVPDLIFRHFVFGGEFLLGDFLRLRGGYNHLRRQELRSANRGGMTGFSLGLGIRGSRFAFDYGFASYGIGNGFQAHQVSLQLALQSGGRRQPPAE
jgi:hypothetical protein